MEYKQSDKCQDCLWFNPVDLKCYYDTPKVVAITGKIESVRPTVSKGKSCSHYCYKGRHR